MMKNILAFIVLAFLAVPFVALAQSSISLETLNAVDIPPDSIVVLSQEETGLSGYIHQTYAFHCLGELRLVDYYSSAFDPKDQDVLQFERVMCARQSQTRQRLRFGEATDSILEPSFELDVPASMHEGSRQSARAHATGADDEGERVMSSFPGSPRILVLCVRA